MTNKKKPVPGVGLDIGTMNIVAARRSEKGIQQKRMRDVFLSLPEEQRHALNMANTSYVQRGDEVIVLGDQAMYFANALSATPRRPLSGGLISASDRDALAVLKLLIESVLGEPSVPDEICYFSVPAPPLDQPDKDIIYHTGVFERIVQECGFEPEPANEAMAIIYAEAADTDFSGLAFSFGSGMTNVALSLNGIEIMSFSVARGGDWIDKQAAGATGLTQARMCALKEAGVDLMAPDQSQEEEALALYYKALIKFALQNVAKHFIAKSSEFQLPNPIPIIVSGGTSKAGNFLPLFEKVWKRVKRKFPIEISEIRQVKDPLNAVAYGMLVQAMQAHADMDE
jgi:hypothetical protein